VARVALPLADPHILVRVLWVTLCLLFVVATLGIGMIIVWPSLGVVGLWFIYRNGRGWLQLKDHRPMYE
jgi:uncharacterized membrane protein